MRYSNKITKNYIMFIVSALYMNEIKQRFFNRKGYMRFIFPFAGNIADLFYCANSRTQLPLLKGFRCSVFMCCCDIRNEKYIQQRVYPSFTVLSALVL